MAKWTVMMFMGAEGVEGNASLELEADKDVAELQKLPSSPNLDIVIDRHGPGAAGTFRLTKGKLEDLEPPQGIGDKPDSPSRSDAVANGTALRDFITTTLPNFAPPQGAAQDVVQNNQDYTMLVLWGHAYNFAFGRTATRFGVDALDYGELARVLSDVTNGGARKLDILAFDACALATIEIAYQFAPFAKYLVASEIGIPLPGWPYDSVLNRLADSLKAGKEPMGPSQLGQYIVRRYCEHYAALHMPVSLSHLDLSKVGALLPLTDQLAGALAIAMDEDSREEELVSEVFEMAQTAEGQPFVDVASLCRYLIQYSGNSDVRDAARALGDAVLAPKVNAAEQPAPFVVENGFNSIETAGLSGVSLYAPHVAPGHDFAAASYFYEKLGFAKKTMWKDVVRALALPRGACC